MLPKYIQNILEQEGVLDSKEDVLATGMAAYAAGDFDAALPRLHKALTRGGSADAVLALATIYNQKGDAEAELATLRHGTSTYANSAALQVALGEYWSGRETPDAAESAFRAALKKDDKFTDAWVKLGVLLFDTNRRDEAQEALEKALALDRAVILARQYMALICIDRKDYKRAATQIHWIKRLDPKHNAAHKLQATIFERQNDLVSAVGELENLVEERADDADTHWRLGKLHLALKAREKALVAFERCVEKDANRWDAPYYAARLCEALDRNDDALNHYLKAVAVRPDHPESNYYAAVLYERAGAKGFERAIHHYQAVVDHEKYGPQATERIAGLSALLVEIQAAMAGTLEEKPEAPKATGTGPMRLSTAPMDGAAKKQSSFKLP